MWILSGLSDCSIKDPHYELKLHKGKLDYFERTFDPSNLISLPAGKLTSKSDCWGRRGGFILSCKTWNMVQVLFLSLKIKNVHYFSKK